MEGISRAVGLNFVFPHSKSHCFVAFQRGKWMYRPCNYMTCICCLLFFSLFFEALPWPQHYMQNIMFIVWANRKSDGSCSSHFCESFFFFFFNRAWSACFSEHHHVLWDLGVNCISGQIIELYFYGTLHVTVAKCELSLFCFFKFLHTWIFSPALLCTSRRRSDLCVILHTQAKGITTNPLCSQRCWEVSQHS